MIIISHKARKSDQFQVGTMAELLKIMKENKG